MSNMILRHTIEHRVASVDIIAVSLTLKTEYVTKSHLKRGRIK